MSLGFSLQLKHLLGAPPGAFCCLLTNGIGNDRWFVVQYCGHFKVAMAIDRLN